MRLSQYFVLGLVLVLTTATGMRAQETTAILLELYGSGVHAYFSENYARAHEMLSQSIDGGTSDPRAYYFRAMAYLKLGRPEEAEADMAQGALLEAQNIGVQREVSRALQRVQGRGRQRLEQHRQAAKLELMKHSREIHRERYEAVKQREEDVLRRQIDVPLDQFGRQQEEQEAKPTPAIKALPAEPAEQPALNRTVPPAEEQDLDPFALPADDSETPEPAIDPNPVAPDPFGETPETVPAKPKASKKIPLGQLGRILTRTVNKALTSPQASKELPPPKAEGVPPTKEAPAPEDNKPASSADAAPFEEADDSADPFSDDSAPPKDAAEDPFGGDELPAADESDPFGDDSPEEPKKVPEKEDKDPFEDSDPFGV